MKKQAELELNSDFSHAVIEQLHAALSKGDDDSISKCILDSTRQHPQIDFTGHLKEAMGRRTLVAYKREYESSLMAVPLTGEILRPLQEFSLSMDLMRSAQKKGMLGADDGVVILNVPIPRGCLQQIPLSEMYQIAPRLFERGAQKSNELVLNLVSNDNRPATSSAIIVILVYWRKGTQIPRLISDLQCRQRFGELFAQFLALERADGLMMPRIWGQPLMPFFEASAAISKAEVRYIVESLFNQQDIDHDGNLSLCMDLMVGSGDGQHRMILSLQKDGATTDLGYGMFSNELLDGSLDDLLEAAESTAKVHSPNIAIRRRYMTTQHSVDESGNDIIDTITPVLN